MAAAAAESLEDQAQQLMQAVSVFSLAGELAPVRAIPPSKPRPALEHKQPVRLTFEAAQSKSKVPLDVPQDDDEWAEF